MREGWNTVKLQDCCIKIGSGATPRGGKEAYLDEGPFSLIRSQNVLDFFFSYNGLAFIDKAQADQLSNVEIKENDVLLNITGDSVARVCQVPSSLLPARVNQHVSIIRPDESKLAPEFLKYYLLNPKFKNHMLGLASVGGTRNALTKGMIEDFEIDLPPIETQRGIAAILSSLDEKIELNRKTSQTLEAIAQTLFKEWFVDFNFPGAAREMQESELGPIPVGWEATKWGELLSLEYGKSLRNYNNGSGPYPVFGTNGKIGMHTEPLCPYPGIIIGRKGAYRGVHFSETPFFVIDTAFYVKPVIPMELRWAYYEMIMLDINGMDSGSAIPSTSRGDFYSLPVIAPPIAIQQAFTRLLTPCWERQQYLERESQTLSSSRDSLLPKLMHGEITV